MTVHTIFVPTGWSVEQVWTMITRGDTVVAPGKDAKGDGVWINVDDKGKMIA